MSKMIGRRSVMAGGAALALGGAGLGVAGLGSRGRARSLPCPTVPAGSVDPVPMDWQHAIARYQFGVALAGLEFGESVFPGRLNAEVQQPPDDRYGYYASRGLRSIRLPYLWERFQPELFGEIDGTLDLLSGDRHLGRVEFRDVVRQHLDRAHAHGMKVLLDPHNYGARALRRDGAWVLDGGTGRNGRFAIGSPQVPIAAFADFCARLAAEYGDHPALLGFDIMNEPVSLPNGNADWFAAAQAAVTAVRRVNRNVLLFIEGYQYANTANWPKLNPRFHELEDPSNKLVFSAHLYFDDDHSGRYANAEAKRPGRRSTPERALADIEPFFAWLDRHGLHGHVGEFGAPDTPEWRPLVKTFLDACVEQQVLVHAWADWPRKGDYVLDLNPAGGPDRQIVSLLAQAARKRCA